MSVRKRTWRDKSGRAHSSWMIHIVETASDGTPREIRKVVPASSKREAEAWERELRTKLVADLAKKETKTPTLVEFQDEFLANARTNNKPSTVDEKQSILARHLIPAFGDLRLDEIGVRQVEAYKSAVAAAGLTNKTINNHLVVLQRALRLAVEYELLDHVPPFKRLHVADPEFDFFTDVEAARLVNGSAGEPEWQRAIIVSLHTGIRRSELIALRWSDIDLAAGRLLVRRACTRGRMGTPKNGKSREVPLSRTASLALKAQRHLRGELVFCQEDGRIFGDDNFRAPLRRACKTAGLREIGWHALRHTFASQLVMRGASIKEVQELLGHSDIKVTMRYAHLSPSVKRDAVRLLDASPTHSTSAAHDEERPEPRTLKRSRNRSGSLD